MNLKSVTTLLFRIVFLSRNVLFFFIWEYVGCGTIGGQGSFRNECPGTKGLFIIVIIVVTWIGNDESKGKYLYVH